MTSSNVANMLISAGPGINAELSNVKETSINKMDDMFGKTLQSFADQSSNVSFVKNDNSEVKSMAQVKVDSTADSKIKKEQAVKASDEENKTIPEEKINELKEKVEDYSSKVKDVIKEELGVSDEEIEQAMEVLGLTVIDLLDPQNVAQLVMQLNGESDSFSLLVSDEFKTIFDQLTEITKQLFAETEMVPVEIKDIMISLDVPEELPSDFVNEFTTIMDEVSLEETQDSVLDVDSEQGDFVNASNTQETLQPVIKNDVESDNNTVEADSTVEGELVQTNSSTQENAQTKNEGNDFFAKKQNHEMDIKVEGDTPIVPFEGKTDFAVSQVIEEVTLPSGQTVSTQEIIEQIVEQAKMFTDSETTTIEMTLNPEGLGKVFMEISQKGDEVTAKLFAENEVVKEALESQMASLRTQMNDSSNKITSIEISVGTHEFEKNLEENAKNQQNSEEQARQNQPKRNHFNLNNLDELSGLMSEEEQLAYQIMRENGNTLDYHA